jgi:hypothetical protein
MNWFGSRKRGDGRSENAGPTSQMSGGEQASMSSFGKRRLRPAKDVAEIVDIAPTNMPIRTPRAVSPPID